MKKEIEDFKKDFEKMKKIETMMKDLVLSDKHKEETKKMESIKMLDLRTKILYAEQYLKIFMDELSNENIEKAEIKYNIKKINEHLEKILEEYTQLTNELDEVIFKKEDENNE